MAGNALAKISRETKRIRKAHPGMSFRSAQKKATSNYHSGAIGAKKKRHTKKSHAKKRTHKPRRKVHKRKRSTRTVVVVSGMHPVGRTRARAHKKRKRSRPKYKVSHRVRRVGAAGGIKTNDILLIGGLGLAAYLLLRPKSNTTTPVAGAPPLTLTTNQARNTQAQQIIAWATAGGLAINAIANLINSLNTKSDAQVSAIHDSIAGGSGVPDWALI